MHFEMHLFNWWHKFDSYDIIKWLKIIYCLLWFKNRGDMSLPNVSTGLGLAKNGIFAELQLNFFTTKRVLVL